MNGFAATPLRGSTNFPNQHALLALLRDGFHAESPGDRWDCATTDRPRSITADRLRMDGDAARVADGWPRCSLAAGAKQVSVGHNWHRHMRLGWTPCAYPGRCRMRPLLTKSSSAHVMVGAAWLPNALRGVVRPDGVHWQIPNLSVHDGSLISNQHRREFQQLMSVVRLTNKVG